MCTDTQSYEIYSINNKQNNGGTYSSLHTSEEKCYRLNILTLSSLHIKKLYVTKRVSIQQLSW